MSGSRLAITLLLAACLAPLAACSSEEPAIKSTLEKICRSRAEGDIETYRAYTGGQYLVQAWTTAGLKEQFERTGKDNEKNGILFLEVYVKSVDVNPRTRLARAVFLEKLAKGTKTWTVNYEWVLEYIDGRWRVIGM